jgi:hypothetical protein
MDFSNEHFVRIYTRDSKTWMRWGWEAQTVFVLTMRKFDLTGRIDDVDDPVADVALLTGLPPDIVREGLTRLFASGTFVHTGRALEAPNYIDGQTASRSDSARCRQYRARLKAKRDAARKSPSTDTKRVAADTKRVATDTSRPTTTEFPATQPNPTQFINTISSDSPSATTDASAALADSEAAESPATDATQAVKDVFDCWQAELCKGRSKLDAKRASRIKARLREGFTVEQLKQAIRGAKKDSFLMGKHPKAGRAFDGIETILRDASQVERLIALENGTAPTANGGGVTQDEGHWL